jgi:hypothetical protein
VLRKEQSHDYSSAFALEYSQASQINLCKSTLERHSRLVLVGMSQPVGNTRFYAVFNLIFKWPQPMSLLDSEMCFFASKTELQGMLTGLESQDWVYYSLMTASRHFFLCF